MNENTFEFTYSAAQRQEVEDIRKKYLPQREDKMELLRRLDAGVTRKGTAVSLVLGVIGALVLGVGMSCAMVWNQMLIGIPVGLAGIVLLAFAYPVYKRMVKKERERIAPEILRLTEELMK